MSLFNSFRTYLRNHQISIQSESNEQRIMFDRGGLNYVFLSDLRDPLYFRILLPRIDHFENEDVSVYKRLNYLSVSYKAGKAVLVDNDVWLSFEQFVDDADDNHDSVFDRGFSVLLDMLSEFKSQAKENQPEKGKETETEPGAEEKAEASEEETKVETESLA